MNLTKLCIGWLGLVGSIVPQTVHVTVTFDSVTNAQWYVVSVYTNNVEAFRRYSMTNKLVISNLFLPLDQYKFTVVATNTLWCWDGQSNSIPVGQTSEESVLPLHLMTVQSSSNLLQWQDILTVPTTNNQQFFRGSNYNANTLAKPD